MRRKVILNGFSLVEVLVVLSLMALLVFFLGSKINNIGEDWRFEKTCYMMEEIKEAMVGKEGLYCNGIKQFTGYVSHMGGSLTTDKHGKQWLIPISLYLINNEGNLRKLEMKDNISGVLEKGYYPQPKSLWTKNIIPDDAVWKYYQKYKIWAGWKGPYVDSPPDGVLKDAWGSPFVFMIGELVTHNKKSYRCINTHDWSVNEQHQPGTTDGEEYWKELAVSINAMKWNWPGHHNCEYRRDRYCQDALVIISYGKDGKPGGGGVDKDLVLTIYKKEWTGEVAGHVGYSANKYVDEVTLYYPECMEKEDLIKSKIIEIQDEDNGYGINFRFGTACKTDDPDCKIDCDNSEPGYTCDYTNFEKVAVPPGIRSLHAGGKTYIFPVEATGNWIGTVK